MTDFERMVLAKLDTIEERLSGVEDGQGKLEAAHEVMVADVVRRVTELHIDVRRTENGLLRELLEREPKASPPPGVFNAYVDERIHALTKIVDKVVVELEDVKRALRAQAEMRR